MYKTQLRLEEETATKLKKVVEEKKKENKKYSINDFIEEAIKEKLKKEEIFMKKEMIKGLLEFEELDEEQYGHLFNKLIEIDIKDYHGIKISESGQSNSEGETIYKAELIADGNVIQFITYL